MANDLSDNIALLVIIVAALCMIAAARALCRSANLRANESGYIYYATCIVCHVVYRVNVVIQGESFVCSSCFRDQQAYNDTQRVAQRVVETDLPQKFFRRITSTFYELVQSKPENVESAQADTCTICFDSPATCVIIPCGHGGLCDGCADVLLLKAQKCHICRNHISSIAHCQDGVIKFGKTLESYVVISFTNARSFYVAFIRQP